MDVQFCLDALDEALERHGAPEILNTDQGSQFTARAWTQRLRDAGTRISMDGRGRFLDNIFIERLWRSLKYECVYLHAFSGGREPTIADAILDRVIHNAHQITLKGDSTRKAKTRPDLTPPTNPENNPG